MELQQLTSPIKEWKSLITLKKKKRFKKVSKNILKAVTYSNITRKIKLVKKQNLYSGYTHFKREMFLPYFYIMTLELISPREQHALEPLTGTLNFSFQLSNNG